mmetsp:Transcript_10921/g.34809  ORF Transcript_10921/g.34809 Transcript_10921/m.34809 type:complete len:217 (-) Transcript_10921:140-790(-)
MSMHTIRAWQAGKSLKACSTSGRPPAQTAPPPWCGLAATRTCSASSWMTLPSPPRRVGRTTSASSPRCSARTRRRTSLAAGLSTPGGSRCPLAACSCGLHGSCTKGGASVTGWPFPSAWSRPRVARRRHAATSSSQRSPGVPLRTGRVLASCILSPSAHRAVPWRGHTPKSELTPINCRERRVVSWVVSRRQETKCQWRNERAWPMQCELHFEVAM